MYRAWKAVTSSRGMPIRFRTDLLVIADDHDLPGDELEEECLGAGLAGLVDDHHVESVRAGRTVSATR